MTLFVFLIFLAIFSTVRADQMIRFSGHNWSVRSSNNQISGPGPNIWNPRNVYVDSDGALHMTISRINGTWTSAEISSEHRMGFGRYQMKLTGRLDRMDPNVVFAMFTYPDADVGPDGSNQLNVEFSRWGQVDANPGAFVVYPAKFPNDGAIAHKFTEKLDGSTSMHGFMWEPERAMFMSVNGNNTTPVNIWTYKPPDYQEMMPQKPMRMHMNFYLYQGHPYYNSTEEKDMEIIINEFTYVQLVAAVRKEVETAYLGLILGLVFGLGSTVLLVVCACVYFRRKALVKGSRKMSKLRETASVSMPFQVLPAVLEHDPELQKSVQRFEIPLARVLLSDILLGKGEYGVVFKGQILGLQDEFAPNTVAIKTVIEDDKEAIRDFAEEIKLMTKVGQHLNIVNLLGVVIKGKPLLVLEYCTLGSLRKFLRAQNRQIPPVRGSFESADSAEFEGLDSMVQRHAKLRQSNSTLSVEDLTGFCYQIARGMEYLSSRNIIHRDLAARNCLVCDNMIIKICDFGLAREREADYNMGSRQALPMKWMAPESIENKVFNQKSDVWSFGVTVWEVFNYGDTPYSREDSSASCREFLTLLESGHRLKAPEYLSAEISRLMEDCWQFKPDARPSFEEVRILLATFVHEDYYLKLDSPYTEDSRYIDVDLKTDPPLS